jgi:hypothetical protein
VSDSYDDYCINSSVGDTYCKKHYGLWPHECGCSEKDSHNAFDKIKALKAENERLRAQVDWCKDMLARAKEGMCFDNDTDIRWNREYVNWLKEQS